MDAKKQLLVNIAKLIERRFPMWGLDVGSGKDQSGVVMSSPHGKQFRLITNDDGWLYLLPVTSALEVGMPVTLDLNTGYVVASNGRRPMGVVSGVSVESNSVEVLLESTGTIIGLKIKPD